MTMSKENKKLLYHYTTMNTFYSMIDHSLVYEKNDINPTYITMWATHYAYQNDPTECQFFFEGLQNRILNYAKTKKVELTDEDKQLIKQPWYGLNIYTISLSTQEDDLTMWRGYGQNGDGISLGFDFSKLPSTLPIYEPDCKEREYRSESDPTYLLTRNIRECKYIDPNNIEIAEEAYERAIDNIFGKDKEWNDVKQKRLINEYAPIYKHYKYKAEGEWRIIDTKLISKYRIGDNRSLIPYIEVNVPINCLSKIIIGPCQDSNNIVINIKKFLWTKGIDTKNIEIVTSEIPYRSRI